MADRLVDTVAQARATFAELTALTEPHDLSALRASGVGQRTLITLYPFDIAEHLPAIVATALHGPHVVEIAALLRESNVLEAHHAFTKVVTAGFTTSGGGAMTGGMRTAEAYLRATYGPWQQGVSSPYENVVYMWVYLLEFFNEVAQQEREPVYARMGLAKIMKVQRTTAHRLMRIVTA